jgi:hypothetical protein
MLMARSNNMARCSQATHLSDPVRKGASAGAAYSASLLPETL